MSVSKTPPVVSVKKNSSLEVRPGGTMYPRKLLAEGAPLDKIKQDVRLNTHAGLVQWLGRNSCKVEVSVRFTYSALCLRRIKVITQTW